MRSVLHMKWGDRNNLDFLDRMLVRTVVALVSCVILLHEIAMSFSLINSIRKVKRAVRTHQPSPGFKILGLPRPCTLTSLAFSNGQLVVESKVILTGGERGLLRGKQRGGWYSVVLHDAVTGTDTVRK